MDQRLEDRKFNRADCIAAIHGQAVPAALGLPVHRLCVIRGIRYHDGYSQELRGVLPEFTRALNARAIMSGRLPDIGKPEDEPYCIWFPILASEESYRKLAQHYPRLKYQIGRACAVAGYTSLYQQLDILPDISHAEEAREAGNLTIFEIIMSRATRYRIMGA